MSWLWCVDENPIPYHSYTPGPLGVCDGEDPAVNLTPPRTPAGWGICDGASVQANGPLVLPQGPNRSSTIGPEAYMQLYRQLDVSYVDRASGQIYHTTADINAYVNYGLSNRRSDEAEKNAVQGLVRATARKVRRGEPAPIAAERRLHNVAIAHAYYGKGAPWEYRVYLAYALTFGRTNPASLQAYCDEDPKLGLDCSGFVNSFLTATGRVREARGIDSYGRNTARTAYTQIRPCDLLIWQQSDADASRHIAIVDRLMHPDKLRVVESSGSKEGLEASDYTVVSVSGDVFQVDRGLNAQGNRYRRTSSVKIVSYL